MINLIVEDYCHECPDFEAEVRKGAKASTIDGHVARCTNIFCVHRLKCDRIARYLAKRMEEKKDEQLPND
jgi:hypothetical protein